MPQHYAPFSYSAASLSEVQGEGSRAFRLLELLPSDQGSQLSCRIFVAKLEESAGQFKALSYVWGAGGKSHFIAVLPANEEARPAGGGRARRWAASMWQNVGGLLCSAGSSAPQHKPLALPITETLHTCLVHLRQAHEPVRLWIDQICINQEDNAEKGDQVRLMGTIYSTAAQVLAWLGPATNGSDLVMDAWQSVGQAVRDCGIESYSAAWHFLAPILYSTAPSGPNTAKFEELLRMTAETFAVPVATRALKHWFARPYFTRAWVVQEFCLCPDTVFICGTKTVPVELLMLAVPTVQYSINKFRESIYIPGGANSSLLSDAISSDSTSALFSCREARRQLDIGNPDAAGSHHLHFLLRNAYVEHSTQATLHRDRVLALLGLATDAPSLGLVPDYKHPGPAGAVRILTAAARAMITNRDTGRIDVLCFAQTPKTPSLAAHGLPTWVPDWRGNLSRSFYTLRESGDRPVFSACGSATSTPQPLPIPDNNNDNDNHDDSVLGLRGYHVDAIEAVAAGDIGPDSWRSVAESLGLFAQLDKLFERAMAKPGLPALYPSQERRAEARWRVPVCDLFMNKEGDVLRATRDVEACHRQHLETLRFGVECMGLGPAERKRRIEEFDWDGKDAKEELGKRYLVTMGFTKGKRPFLTREGYLGLGPAETRPGDVVVVFCGGRIPFVLRPREEEKRRFEFVGEAYCDGVMDGEIVEARGLTEFFMV